MDQHDALTNDVTEYISGSEQVLRRHCTTVRKLRRIAKK